MLLVCHNAGCQAGGTFEFSSEEEQFYIEHGLTVPPKSCPPCREWKEHQQDEVITCISCGRERKIPRTEKISYHRYTGVWTRPTQCKSCERKRRPRNLNEGSDRERSQRDARELFRDFIRPENVAACQAWLRSQSAAELDLAISAISGKQKTSLSSVDVVVDETFYRTLYHKHDRTYFDHIFPSVYDVARGRINRLASFQAAFGIQTYQEAYEYLGAIARSCDHDRIAEFIDGDNIAKYDRLTHAVVICSYESHLGVWYICTAFIAEPLYGAFKVINKAWVPR